jgi:hypothetical protein
MARREDNNPRTAAFHIGIRIAKLLDRIPGP